MIERTALAVAVAAAMAAAAALAVFAAGFALYALVEPVWGAAGAAASVALSAAAACAVAGSYAAGRAREARKAQEALLAHADAPEQTTAEPDPLALIGGIVRDRPILALGLTIAAGVFAARRPDVVRQLARLIGAQGGR